MSSQVSFEVRVAGCKRPHKLGFEVEILIFLVCCHFADYGRTTVEGFRVQAVAVGCQV